VSLHNVWNSLATLRRAREPGGEAVNSLMGVHIHGHPWSELILRPTHAIREDTKHSLVDELALNFLLPEPAWRGVSCPNSI
jgi:hypothetical protein